MISSVIVGMYQLVGALFSLLIPVIMLLGLLWLIAKIGKAFIRSLAK